MFRLNEYIIFLRAVQLVTKTIEARVELLAVELLVSLRHVQQQLAGGEGSSVHILEPPHFVNQDLSSHSVGVPEWTTREWRES